MATEKQIDPLRLLDRAEARFPFGSEEAGELRELRAIVADLLAFRDRATSCLAALTGSSWFKDDEASADMLSRARGVQALGARIGERCGAYGAAPPTSYTEAREAPRPFIGNEFPGGRYMVAAEAGADPAFVATLTDTLAEKRASVAGLFVKGRAFAGFDVVRDPTLPSSVMAFRDRSGATLALIAVVDANPEPKS